MPKWVMTTLIGGVFVLVAVASTMTYVVGFTETAVVTTLGRADADSVHADPGLRFRLPVLQSVTTYDRRARYLETSEETQQTADNRQVVVTAFLTWRVSDPLQFYKAFSSAGDRRDQHQREAERQLRTLLRSSLSQISRFRMEDLLASSLERSRLDDLESAILREIRQVASGDASDLGIEVLSVGLSSLELPQETTTEVFERMKQVRLRLAEEARSQGRSDASTIRSRADTDAERILAFARARAERIRTQGDREAARYLAMMQEDSDLAVFLAQLEFVKEGFGRKMTFIFNADMPGMQLFDLDALRRLGTASLGSSERGAGVRGVPAAGRSGGE